MTNQHTPRKLHTGEAARTIVYDANGWPVFNANVYHSQGAGSAPDNARRMVACWNACQGISTESLEEDGVAGMNSVLALARASL